MIRALVIGAVGVLAVVATAGCWLMWALYDIFHDPSWKPAE